MILLQLRHFETNPTGGEDLPLLAVAHSQSREFLTLLVDQESTTPYASLMLDQVTPCTKVFRKNGPLEYYSKPSAEEMYLDIGDYEARLHQVLEEVTVKFSTEWENVLNNTYVCQSLADINLILSNSTKG